MYIICKSYIAVSKYFAVTAVVNNPHEYTNVHIYNYVQTLPNSLRHSACCSVGKAPGDAPHSC